MLEGLASLGRTLAEAAEPQSSSTRRDPYLYAPVRTGEHEPAVAGSVVSDPSRGDGDKNDGAGAPMDVSHPLLLRSSPSSAGAGDIESTTTERGFVARARQLLSHLSLSEISGTCQCSMGARLGRNQQLAP